MKKLSRKVRRLKKRKALKKIMAGVAMGFALRYGPRNPNAGFFLNSGQTNQQLEAKNSDQLMMKTESQSQSVNSIRVKSGSGALIEIQNQHNKPPEALKYTLETRGGENESLTAQKSELTYSQEELDALGLGKDTRKVTLVVRTPMLHSSQYTLAVHEENWNRPIQESNILNIEQEPKIVLSRTKSDLTNRKWMKEFIFSIRGGGDEKLIKSILSKVAESELDIASINKILERIADAILSVGSNEKLLKILRELEKPVESNFKLFDGQLLSSTEFPKFEDFEFEEFQSPNRKIKLPGFPRRRGQPQIEEMLENKSSTPSSYSIFDSTRCYGLREAYDMPREVTERFEVSAVSKLAKKSLPGLKSEYERVKNDIKQGIHPVNIGGSGFVSANKVLIKCSKGRYLVEVVDTKVDILGISLRSNKKFMKKFETLMNKLYNLNLQGY